MSNFEAQDFLNELEANLKADKPSDKWEYIHHEIDNAVMYYTDCLDIIGALRYWDWEDNELGRIDNITQLAWVALYDYVVDNIKSVAV